MNSVHDSTHPARRPAPHDRRRRASLRHSRGRSGARRDSGRDSAAPRARRSLGSARLRAGAPPAQSAARDRAGDRRSARPDRRLHPDRGGAERLRELLPRSSGAGRALAGSGPPAAGVVQPGHALRARPSSSTRPSTRTRPRTSGTCATPRSATRSAGCCGSSDARSRSRTTSTIPACRWPMSPWAFASSSTRSSTTSARSPARTRFDYYCWDLYARVTEWYEEDKTRLKIRTAALHDIEHGGNPTADLAAFIADRIVRCHLDTMRRLNIRYDLLTWEGDILRLHFWSHAFEFLKKIGAVFLQTEGRLKGCWVMKIEEDEAGGTPEYASADLPAPSETPEGDAPASDTEPREKVIVRSDGTVTYVGKDMAYQLWKFGLLGKDFHYRVFAERPGEPPLWSTTSLACGREPQPAGVRTGVVGLQRHRYAAVVSAEAAQAGARGARVRGAGGTLGPLRVRDGGALARDGAGARLRDRRRGGPPVRGGLGTKGPWRQGRRPHRSPDAEGFRRSVEAQSRSSRRTRCGASPKRSPSPRSDTSW